MGGYETVKWQIREMEQCPDESCIGLIAGSYTVRVYNNGNGTATFVVLDSKTRESGERDPVTGEGPKPLPREVTEPDGTNWRPFGINVSGLGIEPGSEGWGGNMYMRWVWVERIICDECKSP